MQPIIVIIMWLALKFRRNYNDRQWCVRLDTWADLSDTLLHLEDLKANRTQPNGVDHDMRTRTASLATTNTAWLTVAGLREESQNKNSGPGDFIPIRVYGNGGLGNSRELQPMQSLQPAHTIQSKL